MILIVTSGYIHPNQKMVAAIGGVCFLSKIPTTTTKPLKFSLPKPSFAIFRPNTFSLPSISPSPYHKFALPTTTFGFSCRCSSTVPVTTRSYEVLILFCYFCLVPRGKKITKKKNKDCRKIQTILLIGTLIM